MKFRRIKLLMIILLIVHVLFISIIHNTYAQTSYSQHLIPATTIRNNGINNFPDSYKVLLQKLVDKGYKNWKFVAFYTDIDWNEPTSEEHTHLKNTIIKNSTTRYPDEWYCECNQQGDKNYYCASEKILKYYLDPRNFLTEITIFEFLDLSNNSSITVEKIESLVKDTFLDGQADGGIRYAKMIKDAADESGESPYSIVIKIIQELGWHEKGDIPEIISGKNSKYPGVYNFFNYGATDGEGNVDRAYEYAKNQGWTSAYKALVEGAKLMTSNYLSQGQTTKYTYKFDVVGNLYSELFKKQYMTNVQDPTSQANNLYNAYSNNGYLNEELTFIIPIYKNMPTYNKLPSTQTGNLYYISSNYTSVYLRSGPGGAGSGYVNITPLLKDTLVNVIRTGINGFAEVEVEGLTGYVSEQYLTKVNTKQDTYKVPSISELPFNDVDADSWYYNAVKYVYKNNIMAGGEKFEPNTKVTRGMLATIIYKMEGGPKVTGKPKFTDVQDSSKYYYKAIKWASDNGVVSGYKDGRYGPTDNVTREQLAVILHNYAIYKKKNVSKEDDLKRFADANRVGNYAKIAVKWAVASSVINGGVDKKTGKNMLTPKGQATRAEIASMIYKYSINIK